jgi:hypothetical protein
MPPTPATPGLVRGRRAGEVDTAVPPAGPRQRGSKETVWSWVERGDRRGLTRQGDRVADLEVRADATTPCVAPAGSGRDRRGRRTAQELPRSPVTRVSGGRTVECGDVEEGRAGDLDAEVEHDRRRRLAATVVRVSASLAPHQGLRIGDGAPGLHADR